MNKEKIKHLIVEHKERFLKPAELAKRDNQLLIERLLPQKEIIVISGVRRAGKSFLMKLIANDR